MASITSLSNSSYNTSSIYGNRNVLSGLASGMDTETMIENAVSGIKMKIQNLLKKRTKVEWQQEAYRSIIDKAVNFNTKYTSYTSKTNLLSQSFFNGAVNTTALGTYKDKITASGKTNSDIKINAVKQMATAATYTMSGLGGMSGGEIKGITGKEFDVTANIPVSTVSGTLSLQYGGTNGTTFDITLDELENLDEMDGGTNAEKLANAINKKLGELSYNYTKNGLQESTSADKVIKARAQSDGSIIFSDGLGNGNKITISSASGNIRANLGIENDDEKLQVGNTALVQSMPTSQYLSDKSLGFTFNGSSKTVSMAKVLGRASFSAADDETTKNLKFRVALQEELDDTFGKGRITVSKDAGGGLSFTPNGKGDTLSVGGSAVKALGFESGDSNYINTSKKLTDILGDKTDSFFSKANRMAGAGGAIPKTKFDGSTYYVDIKGSYVDKDGYRVDSSGKAIYDVEINGAHIGVTEDTTLESLMTSINANADAGVKVSYSSLTNEFKFTATETGANGKIKFGKLGKDLFGDTSEKVKVEAKTKLSDVLGTGLSGKFEIKLGDETLSVSRDDNSDVGGTVYWLNEKIKENAALAGQGVKASFDYDKNTFVFKDKDGKELDFEYGEGMAQNFADALKDKYVAGQDAILDVEINGKRFEDLTRSSNSINLDGLTVNVKGTFEAVGKDGADYEPITFNTTTDTDKIIEVIREFVNDYNEMASEIKGAYSTLPAEKSDGSRYDPLTAEQEDEYSESELKAYNEKAKQGILFGDTTLSSMYSKLLSAITPGGEDGQALREIGIGTSYSDGMTTLSLDEDKLRAALESDPDKVKSAFTKTTESGSSSNGLMQTLQNTLNSYVKTAGEPKGVLITRAGSIKAPTSINNNTLQSQINGIDKQIERWQDKMASQIDRYTTKFSRLEQLIAEMNSQASAMSGLMGGYGGQY